MDHYGSRFCIDRDVNIILYEVGSKGKENNDVMSLRFIITKCFMEIYNKGFVGQVRGFVSI